MMEMVKPGTLAGPEWNASLTTHLEIPIHSSWSMEAFAGMPAEPSS